MFDISERVRALRKEIGELKNANDIYKEKRGPEAFADRQRREVRLRDIQSELTDLLKRIKPTE
jgi:hypothetical protein